MKLINEAYSDSTPGWLRTAFNKYSGLKNLVLETYKRGLDAINFISYTVPTSPRDDIKNLSAARMVFLKLEGKSATNPNDNVGILVLDPPSQTGRKLWRAELYPHDFQVLNKDNDFVYVWDYVSNSITNWSLLFNNCKDVCYIDTTDHSDSILDKRKKRATTLYYTNPPGHYWDENPTFRYTKSDDISRAKNYGGKFDKSGYALIPPTILKRRLMNKHPDVVAKARVKATLNKIQACYDKLEFYQKTIARIFILDTGSDANLFYGEEFAIGSALNYLKNIFSKRVC